jgi:hypothetical protein
MEKLASNVRTAVKYIASKEPSKDLYFGVAETLELAADELQPSFPYFGLFNSLNALEIKSEQILPLAEAAVPKGLVGLCAWGPDCERVHDCFDEVAVAANLESTDDDIVMTTWHDDETLSQTLWYFVNSAFADEDYRADCKDWLTIVIGNGDWEREARAALAQIVSESKM